MGRPHAERQSGFTLIEILMVMVLVGVLLGIAAPSFRDYSASQRIKTASFDLYSSFIFARSEAIKRRQAVRVLPQTGGDWATGWKVVTGADTLRTQDPPVGVVVTGSASVDYRQDGRLSSIGNVGILVKPDIALSSGPLRKNRCIRIDLAGLPKSTEMDGTTCP